MNVSQFLNLPQPLTGYMRQLECDYRESNISFPQPCQTKLT